jgi:hypothetical protein
MKILGSRPIRSRSVEDLAQESLLPRPAFSFQIAGRVGALLKLMQHAYIPFGLRQHKREVTLHNDQ